MPQRIAWCRRAVEAVVHIHERGVIHSGLHPGNFLVHEPSPGSLLELLLCGFGGSVCKPPGLDGLLALLSVPCYHPVFENKSSISLRHFLPWVGPPRHPHESLAI